MTTTTLIVTLARRWIPGPIRSFVQRYVSLSDLKERWRAEAEPLSKMSSHVSKRRVGGPKVAIIRTRSQYHTQFVRACLELDVSFEIIDILTSDWFARITGYAPDLILFWPETISARRLAALKDRVSILESQYGIPVVPNSDETWMYEDKMRMWYWLESCGIAYPPTHVFFKKSDAVSFAETCDLPIVQKLNFGASASGVTIYQDRRRLFASIDRMFGKGRALAGYDYRDRERDCIILQEHVPIRAEWRMVRIGDSFFGHGKGKVGDFHSGSGEVDWTPPPEALLDLLEEVTEIGSFRSMNVDVFETTDGKFLVNELQAVFGAGYSKDQLRIDGVAGRYIRSADGRWEFEAGDFARNMCANLRLADAMTQLGYRVNGIHIEGPNDDP